MCMIFCSEGLFVSLWQGYGVLSIGNKIKIFKSYGDMALVFSNY